MRASRRACCTGNWGVVLAVTCFGMPSRNGLSPNHFRFFLGQRRWLDDSVIMPDHILCRAQHDR